MSVVLLANVGLRDVRERGQPVAPARPEGQALLRDFQARADGLSLPMLSPMVAYLLRDHPRIQVVLYGTDQPEGETPPEHRQKDTVHLAEVAVKLLQRKHGNAIEGAWAKRITTDPSLYDDMLSFYRQQLSPRHQRWVEEVEQCYVCPVGGTPAANMGLMLAAFERFGEKCSTLYLPEGRAHPVPLAVGEQIRRGVARRLAAERLRELSFGGAAPLLEEAGLPLWMAEVARYAGDRYHFDFDSAAARLERAIRECGEETGVRARCRALLGSLPDLRDRQLPALVRELYHNAATAYRRGEYAAFLGLLFRFQEALLRQMAEELHPGLSTDTGDEAGRRKFREYLQSRPRLLSYLQGRSLKGRPLEVGEATRPLLAALVRYGWEGPDPPLDPERMRRHREAWEFLQRLECLATLRNQSPIGHGFEGVSGNRIAKEYSDKGHTTTPLEDMASSLEALEVPPGKSPFREVAELLLEAMERP